MVDVLKAIRGFLLADATLAALVSTRVFVGPLPKSEAASMPRAAVTIRMSGGPEERSYVEVVQQRIDVFCYGANELGAVAVQRAVWDALKYINREVQDSILLHAAQPTGAIGPLEDPDGHWPMVVVSWLIVAAETTAS